VVAVADAGAEEVPVSLRVIVLVYQVRGAVGMVGVMGTWAWAWGVVALD